MQQYVVPTSPKSPERSQNTVSAHQTFFSILMGIVFGVAGGVVGAIYTYNTVNGTANNGGALFTFARDAEHPLDMSTASRSLAAVYRTAQDRFAPEDFVSSAVVVSSDGWLVMPSQSIQTTDTLAVVFAQGEMLPVVEIHMRADIGIAFVRIARIDLSPAAFVKTPIALADRSVAMQFGMDWQQYQETTVIALQSMTATPISTALHRYAVVDIDARQLSSGLSMSVDTFSSAVFNAKQEFVGFVLPDGRVVQSAWIASAFERMSAAPLTPIIFSYEYLDMYTSEYSQQRDLPRHGMRIVSVTLEGETAVLLPGDVIVSIDGAEVSAYTDFAHEVLARTPGASMTLDVVRSGVRTPVVIQAW